MMLWILACAPKVLSQQIGMAVLPVMAEQPHQALPQSGLVITSTPDDSLALAVNWMGPMVGFDPAMLVNAVESRGYVVASPPEEETIYGHSGASVWIVANGLKGLMVGWVCPDTQRLFMQLVLSDSVVDTSVVAVRGMDLVECHGHGDVAWRTARVNAPEGWVLQDTVVPNLQTWRRPDDREILQVQVHYTAAPIEPEQCEALGQAWLQGYGYGAGMELFNIDVHREGDACVGQAMLPGWWEGGRVRLRVETCTDNELLLVFHTSVAGEETPWVMSGAGC